MPEDFTGIQLKIVLPTEANVKDDITKLQKMIDKHKLNIKLSLDPTTVKGLESLAKISSDVAKQLGKIKTPNLNFDTPNYQTTKFLQTIEKLKSRLEKIGTVKSFSYDQFGKVNVELEKEAGLVSKLTYQWDELNKKILRTNRKDIDSTAVVEEKQLQERQKIQNKIEQDRQKAVEKEKADIKSLEASYLGMFAQIEKTLNSQSSKLNTRFQSALGIGNKVNNLAPGEGTDLLQHQLERYKNIIREFEKQNQLGVTIKPETFDKLQNLENRIKRLYENVKLSQQDSHGFDFKQFEAFDGLARSINQATQAEEYFNKSILEGWVLLKSSVQETEHYVKVTQQLRQGNVLKDMGIYVDKATGNVYKFNESLKDTMTRSWGIGASLKTAFEKAVSWTVVMGGMYNFLGVLQQIGTTILEVDKRLIEMAKVMSADTDFASLMERASFSASVYGKTITDVQDAIVEFARQGYQASEAMKLADTAMLGANVTGIKTGEMAQYLTATMAQFNLTAEDTARVVDKVNEVDNRFAVTSQGLSQSIAKSGETAQAFGVSLDELLGMVTAVGTATKESGNIVGNMFKSVLPRLTSDKAVSALDSIGVSINDTNGDLRSATKIYGDVAAQWDNMTRSQKMYLAESLAGKYHITRMMALFDNWNLAMKATETAQTSLFSATEENSRYLKGLEAQINKVKAAFQEFAYTLGENGVVSAMSGSLQAVTSFIKGLNEFAKAPTILKVGFTALVAVLAYDFIPAVQKATTAFMAFGTTLMLNPFALMGIAIGGAILGLITYTGHLKQVEEEQKQFNEAVKESDKSYKEFIKTLNTPMGASTQGLQDKEAEIKRLGELAAKLKSNQTNYAKDQGWDTSKNLSGMAVGDLADDLKTVASELGVTIGAYDTFGQVLDRINQKIQQNQVLLNRGKQTSFEYQSQLLEQAEKGMEVVDSSTKLVEEYEKLSSASSLSASDQEKLNESYQLLAQQFPQYVQGNSLVISSIKKEITQREQLADENYESHKRQIMYNRQRVQDEISTTIQVIQQLKKRGDVKGTEQKQQDLGNLYNQLSAIDAVINKDKELNASQVLLSESFQKFSSSVADINQVLYDMAEGKKLNSKATMELVQKYPELINAIKIERGNVIVNKQAIEDLRKTKISEFQSTMMAQAGMTQAQASQLKARLRNYGIEISAIQSVADAMRALAQAQVKIENTQYTDMGVRTKQLESVRATMSKYINVLQYRDKINGLIGAVSSPGYGVSGGGGKSGGGGSGANSAGAIDNLNDSIKSFQTALYQARVEYGELTAELTEKVKLGAVSGLEEFEEKIRIEEQFVNKLFDSTSDLNKQLSEWQAKQNDYKKGTTQWKQIQTVIDKIKNDQKLLTTYQTNHIKYLASLQAQYEATKSYIDKFNDTVSDSINNIKSISTAYKDTLNEIQSRMSLNTKYSTDMFGKPEQFLQEQLDAFKTYITDWAKIQGIVYSTLNDNAKIYFDLVEKRSKGALSALEEAKYQELSKVHDLQKALKEYGLTVEDVTKKYSLFTDVISNIKSVETATNFIQSYTEKVKSLQDELKNMANDKQFETNFEEKYKTFVHLFDEVPTNNAEKVQQQLDLAKDKFNELLDDTKKLEQLKFDINTGDFDNSKKKIVEDLKTQITSLNDDLGWSGTQFKGFLDGFNKLWTDSSLKFKDYFDLFTKFKGELANTPELKEFENALNTSINNIAYYKQQLEKTTNKNLITSLNNSIKAEQTKIQNTIKEILSHTQNSDVQLQILNNQNLIDAINNSKSLEEVMAEINKAITANNTSLGGSAEEIKKIQQALLDANKQLEITNKLKDVFRNVFSFDNLWVEKKDEFGNVVKTVNDSIVKTLQQSSTLVDQVFEQVKTKLSDTMISMLTDNDGFVSKLLDGSGISDAFTQTFIGLEDKFKSTLSGLGSQASTYFSTSFQSDILKGMGNLDGILGELMSTSLNAIPTVISNVLNTLPNMFLQLTDSMSVGVVNSLTTILNKAVTTISSALRVDIPLLEMIQPTITKIENTETQVFNASTPTNITYAYNINGILLYREGALRELAYAIRDVLQEETANAW